MEDTNDQLLDALRKRRPCNGQHPSGGSNFKLPASYQIVILGEPGAGKSSTLNVLHTAAFKGEGNLIRHIATSGGGNSTTTKQPSYSPLPELHIKAFDLPGINAHMSSDRYVQNLDTMQADMKKMCIGFPEPIEPQIALLVVNAESFEPFSNKLPVSAESKVYFLQLQGIISQARKHFGGGPLVVVTHIDLYHDIDIGSIVRFIGSVLGVDVQFIFPFANYTAESPRLQSETKQAALRLLETALDLIDANITKYSTCTEGLQIHEARYRVVGNPEYFDLVTDKLQNLVKDDMVHINPKNFASVLGLTEPWWPLGQTHWELWVRYSFRGEKFEKVFSTKKGMEIP